MDCGRPLLAILVAASALTAGLTTPAPADLWLLDPGIASEGDVDDVLEWQGRPVLCGNILDTAGQTHRFVFRHRADGSFAALLPATQSASGAPRVLATWDGALLAGGDFTLTDASTGETYRGVVRWDGRAWRPPGGRPVPWAGPEPGVPATVRALLPVGDALYIAGSFASVDGVPGTANIAVWRDGAYQALAGGLPRTAHCLLWHDGRLLVGTAGRLNTPSSTTLWAWDGHGWSGEATYADLAAVQALVVHDGQLLAGGLDLAARQSPIKRRTPGGAWEPATPWQGAFAQVLELATYRDDLVAGGLWAPAPGMPANKVARWDGTRWRGLGLEFSAPGAIEGVAVTGRRLWLAGDVQYDTRRGLALWVDRTAFGDVTASASGGDGEPRTWTFAWTCDLPADPGSHRLGLWAGGQPLAVPDAAAGLQVTVTPTGAGAWSHRVTVPAPASAAPAEVLWTATFDHYGCRQKTGPHRWRPAAASAAGGAAGGGLAVTAAPNPFNPATTLSLERPRAGALRVEILDVRGRRLRTLAAGWRPAGPLRLRWDGRDHAGRPVSAGRYLARVRAGGEVVDVGLTLVK